MRIAMPIAAALALVPSVRAQVISRLSVDASGIEGNAASGEKKDGGTRTVAISGDGNVVAFTSAASNLVPGDINGKIDVFVFDRIAGTIELVSVDSGGAQADADCFAPSLSADGRVVGFWSKATTLVANDTNACEDSFVHDRGTGITELVSVDSTGTQGNAQSRRVALSSDGTFAAFESNSTNLVANDLNYKFDIFVRDRAAGTTRRVSVFSYEGDDDSIDPDISDDGRIVVYTSFATNLVFSDTNGCADVFSRDTVKNVNVRISVDSSGTEGNGLSSNPVVSGDGSIVAFESVASNLIANDGNRSSDIFCHDFATRSTRRVSLDSAGLESNGNSIDAELSADGKFVAFSSAASNLVANDTNGVLDAFLRDRATKTTLLLSSDYHAAVGNGRSANAVVSGDATKAAFASLATNLVANDSNGVFDVFLDDLARPRNPAAWSSYGAGYPGTLFVPSLTSSANPVLGTTITLAFDDSAGVATTAFLLIGSQSASIPTLLGGTLLVQTRLVLPSNLPPSGGSLTGMVPGDPALFGVSLFAQVLELDAGAAHGVSFTPGLELDFGI